MQVAALWTLNGLPNDPSRLAISFSRAADVLPVLPTTKRNVTSSSLHVRAHAGNSPVNMFASQKKFQRACASTVRRVAGSRQRCVRVQAVNVEQLKSAKADLEELVKTTSCAPILVRLGAFPTEPKLRRCPRRRWIVPELAGFRSRAQ